MIGEAGWMVRRGGALVAASGRTDLSIGEEGRYFLPPQDPREPTRTMADRLERMDKRIAALEAKASGPDVAVTDAGGNVLLYLPDWLSAKVDAAREAERLNTGLMPGQSETIRRLLVEALQARKS